MLPCMLMICTLRVDEIFRDCQPRTERKSTFFVAVPPACLCVPAYLSICLSAWLPSVWLPGYMFASTPTRLTTHYSFGLCSGYPCAWGPIALLRLPLILLWLLHAAGHAHSYTPGATHSEQARYASGNPTAREKRTSGERHGYFNVELALSPNVFAFQLLSDNNVHIYIIYLYKQFARCGAADSFHTCCRVGGEKRIAMRTTTAQRPPGPPGRRPRPFLHPRNDPP